MNILVPSTPRKLSITQTMVEDFIRDPVLAAKVLLGVDLDVFEQVRLRYYWWCPFFMDSSGFSSGKTFTVWVFVVLRSILIYDQITMVSYQTFQSMKDIFWPMFLRCRAPYYQANLGRLDKEGDEFGKETYKEPSCWKAYFKNESQVWCPALGFANKAATSAGRRVNTLVCDEWTKAEAMNKSGSGIDDQLLGRVSRESFNKHHPVWRNHMLFTATACDTAHPAYPRYKAYAHDIKMGSYEHGASSWNYKDWSNLINPQTGKSWREQFEAGANVREMRSKYTIQKFKAEVLGIWGDMARGLYNPGMIVSAQDLGASRGVVPILSRSEDKLVNRAPDNAKYFLGVDPAPAQTKKADDGAIVVLRAIPIVKDAPKREDDENYSAEMFSNPADFQLDLVFAKGVRGATIRQWSGLVHDLHSLFSFSRISVDAGTGGGGTYLKAELSKSRQLINNIEREVRPIATNAETSLVVADFLLTMFAHGNPDLATVWPDVKQGSDKLNDCAHQELVFALERNTIGIPNPPRGVNTVDWSPDRQSACEIFWSILPKQLAGISVRTKEDETWLTTRTGARMFVSSGHDDFVYATIMAYTAFLVWLKATPFESTENEEDCFMSY